MAERMKWEKLLSTETLANQTRNKIIDKETNNKKKNDDRYWGQYSSGDFVNDYERIISSPAFRRLQDKTQVFPLDKGDFVRTRLTHSIEVAAIANRLGVMVTHGKETGNNRLPDDFQVVGKSQKEAEKIQERIDNIPMVLACAGLIHDMGNPPFGHFGEEVIREWFRELPNKEKNKTFDYKGKSITEWLSPNQLTDLQYFDGNAQGIRILSKAYFKPEENELDLAYSVINTLIKYQDTAKDVTKEQEEEKKKEIKKFGYYQAEEELAKKICTTTGTMQTNKKGEITDFRRHPLTYLMEAADDIVYKTDDLEDGVQKGLVTVDQVIKYFKDAIKKEKRTIEKSTENDYAKCQIAKTEEAVAALEEKRKALIKTHKPGRETDLLAFQQWCVYLKEWLMYVVTFTFTLEKETMNSPQNRNVAGFPKEGYEEIMEGSYTEKDLFELSYHKYTIQFLNKVTQKYVHSDAEIEKLELSSKTILNFLLDNFIHAALYWNEVEDKKLSPADKRLMDILSDELKEDYKKICSEDDGERLQWMADDEKYHMLKYPDKEGDRLYRRILMVIDFISGMTDSYARNLYRELNGIGEL